MQSEDNVPVLTIEEWVKLSVQRLDYLALYRDELSDPRLRGDIVGKHELDGQMLYFVVPTQQVEARGTRQ